MKAEVRSLIVIGVLIFAIGLKAQTSSQKPWEVRPPVTKADLKIARRASEILNSPARWNRADTRACLPQAKTFSLYCALEKATLEVNGQFQHRGAAMQEARFVIEDVDPNWRQYRHRLMDYNNDPRTTFPDIRRVLRLLQDHIAQRLAEQARRNAKCLVMMVSVPSPRSALPVGFTNGAKRQVGTGALSATSVGHCVSAKFLQNSGG